MNYGYLQQVMAEQNRANALGNSNNSSEINAGLHLGQFLSTPSKAELAYSRQALVETADQTGKVSDNVPDTIGKAFAGEVIRRMGEMTGDDGQPKDSSDLQQSLGDTMDWLRERYGDETAAAAAGMILQSTSSGVTEDSLGTGLLNTLKFIDRNFGFAAGDEAIAQFNGGINQSVNRFFDNGRNEIFHAAEPSGESGAATASARFISQVVDDSDIVDSLDELTDTLDDLKGELDKIGQLQDLVTQLEGKFSPSAPSPETAMAAYEAAPAANEPQLASLTV